MIMRLAASRGARLGRYHGQGQLARSRLYITARASGSNFAPQVQFRQFSGHVEPFKAVTFDVMGTLVLPASSIAAKCAPHPWTHIL